MAESPIIPQAKMMQTLIPVIKNQGQVYRKFKKVWARKAVGGEKVATVTSDGVETTNTAKPGDMIVRNFTGAGERYIAKAEKFQERYKFEKEVEDGYSQYHPLGRVIAVKVDRDLLDLLKCEETFKFIAPWGEPMTVHKDDFLVCPPDFSEIYRIARKEFFETYKLDT